jgi:hypothetical protein
LSVALQDLQQLQARNEHSGNGNPAAGFGDPSSAPGGCYEDERTTRRKTPRRARSLPLTPDRKADPVPELRATSCRRSRSSRVREPWWL